MFDTKITTVAKKVEGMDIVVEVKVNEEGKIVSQQSFTKEQLELQKTNSIASNTKAIDRLDSLLAVFE